MRGRSQIGRMRRYTSRISKYEEHGLNAVAKIAGVSRGTVVAARSDLAGEARK